MSFSHPEYLRLLLLLPAIVVAIIWGGRRARSAVALLVGGQRFAEVARVLTAKTVVGGALTTIMLASLVVAASGPGWGMVSVEDDRNGLELVFLFDVSNSMRAEDIVPSRLARAREIARAVSVRLPAAHRAVVSFRGSAATVVPMTDDEAVFDIVLSNINSALISTAGTSIEAGVVQALDAFPSGSPRRQAVVMFSDGEALQGDLGALSERLRVEDIPFIVVATGTQGGATIPLGDGSVVRDSEGNPVIAGLERHSLERIAEFSGGELLDVRDPRIVTALVEAIDTSVGIGNGIRFRQTTQERYELFAIIALAAAVLQIVVHARVWRRLI